MIVIDRSTRAFLPAGELGRNDDYEGKVHSELMELRVQVSMGSEASPADEQRLVAEVLAKDRKATAAFVGRCSDWVYSFVRYRLYRILRRGEPCGYVILNDLRDRLMVAHCDGDDAEAIVSGVLLSVVDAYTRECWLWKWARALPVGESREYWSRS